jgi:hypothetical protein
MPLELHQRDRPRLNGAVRGRAGGGRRRVSWAGGGRRSGRQRGRRPHGGGRPATPALSPQPSRSRTTPHPCSYVERDGKWHHLAVTWSTADNGLTEIYWDGLLTASAFTGKTEPLDPHGAFMLGGEQDCFGGCTDSSQGFYGTMDEVGAGRGWVKMGVAG